MKKKSILITFDYELFLGKRSGSVNKCVIEPTKVLLDVFSEFKLTNAIFFVDTTWLFRLKEIAAAFPSAKSDYELVCKQLCELLAKGHYVFPHIHPHWLDAVYKQETNEWELTNYSKYRFNSLSLAEREKLFEDSITVLKEILGQNYTATAYRAGGWSIQPFEDFEPLFNKYGVKYDFSILPGSKYISSGQYYDFSKVTTVTPYSFSNDVSAPSNGGYTEFPISTIKISAYKGLMNKVLLKYLAVTNNTSYVDGQGIVAETVECSESAGEMVSIELLNRVKLPIYLTFLEEHNYMQFIAHPKMLTKHNINTFNRFLRKVKAKYEIETDFVKMTP